MSTINERLGKVVSASGLSKTAFAKRINVTQQYVSKMVVEGMPSDRTISDICREFGVDEVWLRHGEGEMFRPRSRKDAIAAYRGRLLGNQRSEFGAAIIAVMAHTRPAFWDIRIEAMRPLAKRIVEKKPPDPE